MSRGHIRKGRAFSEAAQTARLLAFDPKMVLYVDDIEGAIRSCRKEPLYCVGLRGLAGSRLGIESAVEKLHKRGSWAEDVTTATTTRSHGVQLMSAAIKDLANERLGGHAAARSDGRNGGRKAGQNRRKLKTPIAIAEKIWFDKSLPDNASAVEKINDQGYRMEWSLSALYKLFGKRGVAVGRRPKMK